MLLGSITYEYTYALCADTWITGKLDQISRVNHEITLASRYLIQYVYGEGSDLL